MKIDLGLPTRTRWGRRRSRASARTPARTSSCWARTSRSAGRREAARIDLRLQDTAPARRSPVTETGTEADFDLASRAGTQLRESLARASPRPTRPRVGLAALEPRGGRLYAEGLARLRSFDALSARDLLEQARGRTGLAPAHAALAAAWSALGYDAKAVAESKKAFDLASDLARNPPRWSRAATGA